VPGVPWRIITGSGLDDWIYWQPLLQSLVITINYKNSQSMTAYDSLHSRSSRSLSFYDCLLFYCDWLGSHLRVTHSLLNYEWRTELTADCSTNEFRLTNGLLYSLELTHRKHIRYRWEVFSARCVATSTARTTENTVHVLLAACLLEHVYRAVVLQLVYASLYESNRMLKYNIRVLPVFVRRWKIHKYFDGNFVPWGYLRKIWRALVHIPHAHNT
jgi:hypothetical protein